MTRVQGKEVTTVEGLREPLRTRLAAAICREDAFVCGFCIPGVVVRLHSLLEGTPRPSRDEIAKAIASNLCRCTGWQTIVDAVASCGVGAEDEASKAREEDLDVVLGRHRYVADAHDVELWAAPLCAGVPAGALRGISGEGLLTATAIGSWLPEDSVVREGGQIRDPGDIIALGIGETLSKARLNVSRAEVRIDTSSAETSEAFMADVDGWLSTAQDPGFLEPEAAVAEFRGGVLDVVSQTDMPARTKSHVESVWPDMTVTLRVETKGGSYGGKAASLPALLAAAAAKATGRRVGVVFGRRESLLWHPRRHPARVDVDVAQTDGRLERIDGRIVFLGGGAEIGPCPYDTRVDVHVDVRPGRPSAPIRGDGLMQWTFALEHALLDARVDRIGSLLPLPRDCVTAVEAAGGEDGWGVAGSAEAAVAAGIRLGPSGRVERVDIVASGETGAHTRRDVMSGAHMGLGAVLSESVPMRGGVPTPGTIRSLGLLRLSQTPELTFRSLGARPTSAPLDTYAVAAVTAALVHALRLRFGDEPAIRALPMLDAPPAKQLRRR